MTDALDGLKAAFDALATSPASTFTSVRGFTRSPDTGTGKTANRFVFFRLGSGGFGARGAGHGAGVAEGEIIVVATMPVPAPPTSAAEDTCYDLMRQLDDALTATTPSRVFTSNSRKYAVDGTVDHDALLVVTGWPWGAGQDYYTMSARFGVQYVGV
jgi:hypothetical protein